MPFRPRHSLLNVDVEKMHTIDTRSVENLFGMWSVFSKTSDALEDGKRLENLSWRLWNRETFCCCPETQARSTLSPQCAFPPRPDPASISRVPELATSFETASDDSDPDATLSALDSENAQIVRPELRRVDSQESRSRGREKHITPNDLEKIVISIRERKSLEPLAPLPLSVVAEETTGEDVQDRQEQSPQHEPAVSSPSPEPASSSSPLPPPPVQSQALCAPMLPPVTSRMESSASTVGTSGSDDTKPRQSSESSSTAMSTHSIVRGFTPGGMPSSYRSQTQLAQPTPILKTSSSYRAEQRKKKQKAPMFTLGGSSGEDESSLDSHMYKNSVSSLSEQFRPQPKKQTAFKEDVTMSQAAVQDSPVFESDDEDDEDVSESVIEDDEEDSSDWEDEMGEDAPSESDERDLFQRVDSRPNLTSRRSMLTSLMHEGDRAKAIADAAATSRSVPALRRSRATSPNGPSLSTSPLPQPQPQPKHAQKENRAPPGGIEMSRAKPIILTTSNTHQQPALSPRTTRRNMLSTELTESLRKNLLWERQHKSSQNIAALKRRHTSTDVKNLKQYPDNQPVMKSTATDPAKFSNDFFHAGLQEYHAKGW